MLLPITFGLPPVGALIMLAGIYYGAQYGGSTTSILVNIPGEAGSVVTTLDGHQMAKQGRAGPALAIAAIGSFFAGCVATVLIALLGAPLTKFALQFGPAEYFSLMTLGLVFAVVLAKGSVLKAIAMIVFGLLLVDGRLRSRDRRIAHGLQHARACRRAWLRHRGHGRVRLCRDHPQSRHRRGEGARTGAEQGHRPDADQGRPDRLGAGDPARHCSWLDPRHPAGRRRGDRVVCGLHVREEDLQAIRRSSARARSRALPRRKAPTMPRRRPRSFRC